MVRYKVVETCFIKGTYRKPGGKHDVVHFEAPLKDVPSCLERMKDETPAEQKARAKTVKKTAKEAAEKKASDQKDIAEVTFVDPPNAAAPVETL
tara:strand:- start:37609 stop:37890 length:282 start_codon:yes stop_codon:yes gene_type:complete